MFRKILVAIDGSEQADRAFEAALAEAGVWKSEAHVVYVVESGLFSSLPMDSTLEIIYSVLHKEGEEILESARKKAETAGIPLTTHLCQGHVGSQYSLPRQRNWVLTSSSLVHTGRAVSIVSCSGARPTTWCETVPLRRWW
jgi:Universal stress protein UspA and related nucleotide-binding proteins